MNFMKPVKIESIENFEQISNRQAFTNNDEIDELFNSALVENLDSNEKVI